MLAYTQRRTATVLVVIFAGLVVLVAGCNSHIAQSTASVDVPPSSAGTAIERAATQTWFAATNQMFTKHSFDAIDEVTIGSMRAIYQYEAGQTATATATATGKRLTMTDVSITLACQNTSPSIFVAYARTDVFTLGQGTQSAAMVFQEDGPTWKLAAAVTHLDGSSWPVLCQASCPDIGSAELAGTDYTRTLAAVLNHATTGTTPTPAQAHPFAVNSYLSGSGSITDQAATSMHKDQSAGVQLRTTFTTTSDPTFALQLADNRGYWLIGTLEQHDELVSRAGITGKDWPDGTVVDTPRPSTVHQQTDEFITTYTAVDPVQAATAPVTLNGFFGWPIVAVAG